MEAKFLANAPMTAQALELGLTAEIQENCRVVYEKDKDSDGYVFHSLWHSKGEYGGEHIIMPVGSTYAGLSDELPAGTCFANVQWSSGDIQYNDPDYPAYKNYKLSWIKLIRRAYAAHAEECRKAGGAVEVYDADLCCAERDMIYPSDGSKQFLFKCSNNGKSGDGYYLHGAHVKINATSSGTAPIDGVVYLLPLCSEHNTYVLKKDNSPGTGYYMKLERPMRAVRLNGYRKNPVGPLPI